MAEATNFDLFDFMSGAAYPEESISVYTDRASVYARDKIETQISNERDSAKVDELAAQSAELSDKIRSTSITFTLRGLPSPIVEEVEKKVGAKFGIDGDNEERAKFRMMELIALHIVQVTRADGAKDERTWDAETTERLMTTFDPSQRDKLITGVMELTLKAREFEDYTVTPDFS